MPTKTYTPPSINLIAESQRLGLTSEQIARDIGVSERQVMRWRDGQEPRYKFVCLMAAYFNRSVQWFYTDHTQ